MKFAHISDLHIGKRVNEVSMIPDQRFILKQILQIIDEEKVDGVLIAGDIYDRQVPSAEAVCLFDEFLTSVSDMNCPVYMISGNHDSAERVAFGNKLFRQNQIYIADAYQGEVALVSCQDSFGEVNIYLMPFIKPVMIRHYHEDAADVESYTEALRYVISQMKVDASKRNVLIAHQYVTGAIRSESEETSLGGLDCCDGSVFDDFDYVALGHIHRPQKVSRDTLRYCGSPLKYSFSEAPYEKSVSIVELREKGNVEIYLRKLTPLHDMKEIKGKYEELVSKAFYRDLNCEDYFHITLTDEEDILDVIGKLRVIYPNLMKIDYDNSRTRQNNVIKAVESVEEKTPLQLFRELYELQMNAPMSEQQEQITKQLMEKIFL